MQPSILKGNVSSDYIGAFNALRSKSEPDLVLVYVESDEDIAFWRHILGQFENDKLEFQIQTPDMKGKTKAIEKTIDVVSLAVGKHLIACVDSDYDFLLPEHSEQAKKLNKSPYIFQTYSYSIENLQCFASSLHGISVQATKHDKRLIDFEDFLSEYSKMVYPLFLWNLYWRSKGDHTTFTLSDFCKKVKLLDKMDVSENFQTAFKNLKDRVDAKIQALESTYPGSKKDIQQLELDLAERGLTSDKVYLFAQGHTIKDNVVLMAMKAVCGRLIKDKEGKIKAQHGDHPTQLKAEMNAYRNQKQDVATVLDANTEFKACFLYKKIEADLVRYFAAFKGIQ